MVEWLTACWAPGFLGAGVAKIKGLGSTSVLWDRESSRGFRRSLF